MKGHFPAMSLAINPPLAPMEAREVDELPAGAGWLYEPKWDGFRCLAFRDGRTVVLQAKSGEPLTRYFPELVMSLASMPHPGFLLDGEIVVIGAGGQLSHDDLMARIHPSARRVAQLSAKTPATLLAFDLLADEAGALIDLPLGERRKRLERFFGGRRATGVELSPATARKSEALGWLRDLGGAGVDGVIAKRKDAPYRPGDRDSTVKLKLERTIDCVVGGVRRSADGAATSTAATLLLGLYDEDGLLHFVGATAPLPEAGHKGLAKMIAPLVEPPGFSGRQPPPRAGAKARDFEPLRSALVCELRYDRFVGERFRSPPTFLRWRPDKKPAQCTFEQLRPPKLARGHGLDRIGL